MTFHKKLVLSVRAILAAGLWLGCVAGVLAQTGPKPTLRLNLSETYNLDSWQGDNTPIIHSTAKGELVLIQGQLSVKKAAHALVSNDRGRTWHEWGRYKTWPKMAYADVICLGDELLAFGSPTYDVYEGILLWQSDDEGLTWTGGERLTPDTDRYAPMNQRIFATSRGRLIVPVEQLLASEGLGPNQIGTVYSDDDGRSWQRSPIFGPPAPLPDRPEGFGEPAVVELADSRLWMVFRTRFGHLWQAWSTDDGASWGEASPTPLVSPLSAVNAKRIPGSDAVIVIWNHAKPGESEDWNAYPNLWNPRSPLTYAVSKDNCQSWSEPVVIDTGTAAYPGICFSRKEMFVSYWQDPDPKARFLNPNSDLILVAYDIQSLLRSDD